MIQIMPQLVIGYGLVGHRLYRIVTIEYVERKFDITDVKFFI